MSHAVGDFGPGFFEGMWPIDCSCNIDNKHHTSAAMTSGTYQHPRTVALPFALSCNSCLQALGAGVSVRVYDAVTMTTRRYCILLPGLRYLQPFLLSTLS